MHSRFFVWSLIAAPVSLIIVFWLSIPWLCRLSVARGVAQGRLADCPGSPNCVSTQASNPEQRLEPIPCQGKTSEILASVRQVVESMPGATVVKVQGAYLHATFRTPFLRFIDDVEFWFDEPQGLLHFRSASRLGRSDLGTNRRRMEQIRSQWPLPT